MSTGRLVRTLAGHTGSVRALAGLPGAVAGRWIGRLWSCAALTLSVIHGLFLQTYCKYSINSFLVKATVTNALPFRDLLRALFGPPPNLHHIAKMRDANMTEFRIDAARMLEVGKEQHWKLQVCPHGGPKPWRRHVQVAKPQ